MLGLIFSKIPKEPPVEELQLSNYSENINGADIDFFKSVCHEYETYLEEIIKGELRKQNAVFYRQIFEKKQSVIKIIDGAIIREEKILGMGELIAINDRSTINDGTTFYSHKKSLEEIKSDNKNFTLAIDKYKAIVEMRGVLETNEESQTQLDNFCLKFYANRKTIEKRRDSGTIIFLKALATLSSFFLVNMFGIWRVRGEETGKKIESHLPGKKR